MQGRSESAYAGLHGHVQTTRPLQDLARRPVHRAGPAPRDCRTASHRHGACEPDRRWQRGSTQNAQGLLRAYLPEGRVFSTIAAGAFGRAEPAFNHRPCMSSVVYLEIPVLDMQRARAFYERVFRVSLELQEIDGNEMALFPYADGQPGAAAALARGSSYAPGKAGARIYFGVDDIAHTLQLAVAAGAEVHYPITEVPRYGWVAEFIDVEGNCIALYARQAPVDAAA